MSLRYALPLLLLTACGHAEAPPSRGFTGTCKLGVPKVETGYVYTFRTPDEMKTHVTLRIVEGTLTRMHVETADDRNAAPSEQIPDDPLIVGDVEPKVPLDPEVDVDVPIQLVPKDAHGETVSPWDLPVRVRFHGRTADAVVGRMRTTGDCTPDTPPD